MKLYYQNSLSPLEKKESKFPLSQMHTQSLVNEFAHDRLSRDFMLKIVLNSLFIILLML